MNRTRRLTGHTPTLRYTPFGRTTTRGKNQREGREITSSLGLHPIASALPDGDCSFPVRPKAASLTDGFLKRKRSRRRGLLGLLLVSSSHYE
ncbi:hypothetical protein MUK42_34310 [Musa troglodytarum]|uniref:Uncharacterized protein n=1 Tax=Musa troglodytarum TaxID=320322 RepID=A0A9E7KF61_9LILI|nr:hypothetical protein MUK42_34310 [Musa troglodytarum]